MPWDASLNKDVDDAVNRHIAATFHLPQDHDLKFSRATARKQTEAYLRVSNGIPTSDRIIQDCDRTLESLETVRLKRGRWSSNAGLARGSGHRAVARTGGHGGRRVKKAEPGQDEYYYPGVREVRQEAVDASVERARKKVRAA